MRSSFVPNIATMAATRFPSFDDFCVAVAAAERRLIDEFGNGRGWSDMKPQTCVDASRGMVALIFAGLASELSRRADAHVSGIHRLDPAGTRRLAGNMRPEVERAAKWWPYRTLWLAALSEEPDLPGDTPIENTYDNEHLMPWLGSIRNTQLAAIAAATYDETSAGERFRQLVSLFERWSKTRADLSDVYLESIANDTDFVPDTLGSAIPPAELRYRAKLVYFTSAPNWVEAVADHRNSPLLTTEIPQLPCGGEVGG